MASLDVCQKVEEDDSVSESFCRKLSEQELIMAPERSAKLMYLLISFMVFK